MAPEVIVAAREGRIEDVHRLLSADPRQVTLKDSIGQTALMWTAYRGFHLVTAVLLEFGATVDDGDSDSGRTPLYVACEFGNLEVVELLLNHGADAEFCREMYRRNCLMIACYNGHGPVVDLLLKRHVYDLETRDRTGATALRLCAANASLDSARAARSLLQAGADPGIPDDNGVTALAQARKDNREELIDVLEDWERCYLLRKARRVYRATRWLEAADMVSDTVPISEVPRHLADRVEQGVQSLPHLEFRASEGARRRSSLVIVGTSSSTHSRGSSSATSASLSGGTWETLPVDPSLSDVAACVPTPCPPPALSLAAGGLSASASSSLRWAANMVGQKTRGLSVSSDCQAQGQGVILPPMSPSKAKGGAEGERERGSSLSEADLAQREKWLGLVKYVVGGLSYDLEMELMDVMQGPATA